MSRSLTSSHAHSNGSDSSDDADDEHNDSDAVESESGASSAEEVLDAVMKSDTDSRASLHSSGNLSERRHVRSLLLESQTTRNTHSSVQQRSQSRPV